MLPKVIFNNMFFLSDLLSYIPLSQFVRQNRAVMPHCVVRSFARSFIVRQSYFGGFNIKRVSLWPNFVIIL